LQQVSGNLDTDPSPAVINPSPLVNTDQSGPLNYVLLATYAACHLPLLFLANARFWDDWVVYDISRDALLTFFRQAGLPWGGYLHLGIQAIGWWAYPFVTFAAFLAIVLCSHQILLRLRFSRSEAFWIAALIAVIPIDFARVSAATVLYSVSMALFTGSWLLLLRTASQPWSLARLGADIGFLLSFQLASLLVLFLLPAATMFLYHPRPPHNPWSLVRRALRASDVLLLPIAYWLGRNYFFPTSGVFTDYNTLDLSIGLVLTPLLPQFEALWGTGFSVPLGLLILIGVALAFIPPAWLRFVPADRGMARPLTIALLGVFVSYLAAFPYLAVGKLPTYAEWTSTRHYLPMLFGVSLTVYGLLAIVSVGFTRPGLPPAVHIFIAALCVCSAGWWNTYAEFIVDDLKQGALAETIRRRPDLTEGNIVIVDTTGLNAFDTSTGLAEYSNIVDGVRKRSGTLMLDYRGLGTYSGWNLFIERYGKYFGEVSKTEGVDPGRPRKLYILSSEFRGSSKFLLAVRACLLRLRSVSRRQDFAARLVTIEGPFGP
jgi:hypothetical protein